MGQHALDERQQHRGHSLCRRCRPGRPEREVLIMRSRICRLALLFLATAYCGEARADAETDRLREALRSATMQARQLEDQRAASQAKLADAEKEKVALKAQIDAAKAEVKRLEKQHREAV